ncbi:MAG: cyclic nucleotide-binding domain-containing protein [Steroidobacteraceae bacterium]|jgi:CRP-like cAMP-binding protein|nr:cyclic nucleotide-binding domain-containing protein [Steroidobacteraceae bacterium]
MEGKALDLATLRSFSPLDGLKRENLAALARKTTLRRLDEGRLLFKEGDEDKRTFYLVSGELELVSGDRLVATLKGGSPEARNPVAPGQPRRFTARAITDVEYISVDSEMLDVLITWDQTGTYEVSEIGGDGTPGGDDWMTVLLQTKSFHRVPPANIQALFMRMQRVNYKAGEVVIKQGDEGDYFYVITRGRCVVTRETPLNREGIRLAELGVGESFGEEALISEGKRNATVAMLTDGSLMRLGKEDFNSLLNEPLLHWVDLDQARDTIAHGGVWLDVRLPSEYELWHPQGAVNIPLYFIRIKLKTLDRSVPYVLVCETGRRSSAAAFLLSERGYDASCLRGGLLGNALGPAAG